MNSGWIALPRGLSHHWIWQNPKYFQMWVKLVFLACWEDSIISLGKTTLVLKRGEMILPIKSLAHELRCSKETVSSFLTTLEESHMIRREIVKNTTKIIILKYDEYSPKTGSKKKENLKVKNSSKFNEKEMEDNLKNDIPTNNKKIIEENNNIIISKKKEQNLKFYEDIKNSEEFWKELADLIQQPVEKLREKSETFFRERQLKEDYHATLSEVKNYLVNWLKKIFENQKQNNLTTNQNNNGKTGTENKRGFDAPAPSREELSKGAF